MLLLALAATMAAGCGGKERSAGKLAGHVSVAGTPVGIANTVGRVLVSTQEGQVLVYDATSGKQLAALPVAGPLAGIAVGRYVWVLNVARGTVSILSPTETPEGVLATERATGKVGARPDSVTLVNGEGWVTASSAVWRVNDRGQTRSPIQLQGQLGGITTAAGAVWVASGDAVTRIDPRSGQVIGQPIPVGPRTASVVNAFGTLWVSYDNSVARIDPKSGAVVGHRIRVGRNTAGIASGAGSVWVANFDEGTVSRIDPKAGKVIGKPIKVGAKPLNVTFAGGYVWVTVAGARAVVRVKP